MKEDVVVREVGKNRMKRNFYKRRRWRRYKEGEKGILKGRERLVVLT